MKATALSQELNIEGGVLSALGGVVVAALGALGLWLANRLMGKAAFQTAINNGFKELMESLRDELKDARQERDSLRQELEEDRVTSAAQQAVLRGEILNLVQTIESLKNLLRANGIAIPEHKNLIAPSAERVMIELRQEKHENQD